MKNFRIDSYKNSPLFQNNPGNLPNKGIDWLGKVPTARRLGNSKYEEFYTVEYGIRALMRNIRTLMDKEKLNTIAKFSRAFYPATSAKKVALYENTLSYALSVDKNKVITTFDQSFYTTMAKAIIGIEMGSSVAQITDESYIVAFSLINFEYDSKGGNSVAPSNNKSSVPSAPRNTPSVPSTPAPSNPTTDNYESPSEEGTNWFLWGGLAVALGAGGYLFYNYYKQKKK
jgi:hypothetical protein